MGIWDIEIIRMGIELRRESIMASSEMNGPYFLSSGFLFRNFFEYLPF